MKKRKDINKMITDRIIQQIKSTGTLPWKKPWTSHNEVPRNLISGKPYRGINAFLLFMMGYDSPCWLTMHQVNALGGKVRKGEHSTPVVFWKILEDDEQEEADGKAKRSYALLRYYRVFNAAQCEGLPEARLPAIPAERPFAPVKEAERLIRGMPSLPKISHSSRRASYSPLSDTVMMPPKTRFHDEAGYYAALSHEIAHSTGHSSRLNRKTLMEPQPFGSKGYAKEELVAEMTAAFFCGHCGLLPKTEANSAAYLKHWLQQLEADPSMLINAGSQAQKAFDYITGTTTKTAGAAKAPVQRKEEHETAPTA